MMGLEHSYAAHDPFERIRLAREVAISILIAPVDRDLDTIDTQLRQAACQVFGYGRAVGEQGNRQTQRVGMGQDIREIIPQARLATSHKQLQCAQLPTRRQSASDLRQRQLLAARRSDISKVAVGTLEVASVRDLDTDTDRDELGCGFGEDCARAGHFDNTILTMLPHRDGVLTRHV
jgi:hypothetical protein